MIAHLPFLCYNIFMKYEFLLLDIDDTALDFLAAEKFAFKKTHGDYGIPFEEKDYFNYSEFNKSLWKRFEKNEISLDYIKNNRFRLYFESRSVSVDAAAFQLDYEENLALCGEVFEDGVIETLSYISNKAQIYAITNGMSHIQEKRLKLSGLDKFIKASFVSECIGVRKPEKLFFDYVENNILNFDKEKALVVRDSLSADIPAGLYGYKTCLINRKNTPVNDCIVKPDYIINEFNELKNFFP